MVGLGVAAIWLLHSGDPCLQRPAEGTEEPGGGGQRQGRGCGQKGVKISCNPPVKQGHKSSHTVPQLFSILLLYNSNYKKAVDKVVLTDDCYIFCPTRQ